MEEQENIAVIAAEIEPDSNVLQALEQRIAALESALGELRSVAASGTGSGRKTVATAPPREGNAAALDAALGSLSLEQRIAVKSHMLRSGLL